MYKLLIKATLIVGLLAPMLASAKTYGASSVIPDYSFSLTGLSNVDVGYSWINRVLTNLDTSATTEYAVSGWEWTLNGPTSQTDSFANMSGTLFHNDVLSLKGLASGNYQLFMTGMWDTVTVTGNHWSSTAPDLYLGDTFKATPVSNATTVSAVPEPDTLLMMLTGLGLMGSIALRRKNKNKSI